MIGCAEEVTVQCEGPADILTGAERTRCLSAYFEFARPGGCLSVFKGSSVVLFVDAMALVAGVTALLNLDTSIITRRSSRPGPPRPRVCRFALGREDRGDGGHDDERDRAAVPAAATEAEERWRRV